MFCCFFFLDLCIIKVLWSMLLGLVIYPQRQEKHISSYSDCSMKAAVQYSQRKGIRREAQPLEIGVNVLKFISEQDFMENQLPNINECSIHEQAVFDILMCWWCSPSWLHSSTLAAPLSPIIALQPLVRPSALLSWPWRNKIFHHRRALRKLLLSFSCDREIVY